MKTSKNQRLAEETKVLFKEFFTIQHRLEQCAENAHPSLEAIIHSIDELLETLLRLDQS